MYGAQTVQYFSRRGSWFENDVEMYGAQTTLMFTEETVGLRMM